MPPLNIDTGTLSNKAKESFADSLIDFGASAAKFATYMILVMPVTILVKLVLDEKDVIAFLLGHAAVAVLFSLIFLVGMVLASVFRNKGILLLNELPDCCEENRSN